MGELMRSSYLKEDVTILLKDITGLVTPLATKEREKYIQQGVHYSEMLPLEYLPSPEYLKEYKLALEKFAKITAQAVKVVAEKILQKKGDSVVLVSLARAGTPIGILIKRYLQKKYSLNVPHFTISIIRGRGIDHNALQYILNSYPAESLQFVDGWTGKGAILKELTKEASNYDGLSADLAVLSDPANITNLCGTHDDFLIASSCLNSTVSGLMSRTFFRKDIVGRDDFHGAAFYEELLAEDRSYEFINHIENHFDFSSLELATQNNLANDDITGMEEVAEIYKHYNITDINFIKPGVGETTRVLLRRVPFAVLVNDLNDTQYINHILRLATEKKVPVLEYPLKRYRACGIIKNISDI